MHFSSITINSKQNLFFPPESRDTQHVIHPKKSLEQSMAIFSWFYKGRGGRFEARRRINSVPQPPSTPLHPAILSVAKGTSVLIRLLVSLCHPLSRSFATFYYLLCTACMWLRLFAKPVRFFSFSLVRLHCARERHGLITIHNSQTLNGLQPSKKKERKLLSPFSLLWLVSFSLSSPHGSVSKKTVARLCGEQWRTRLNL